MSHSTYKEELQAVAELEKSLNLPKDFFLLLRDDDDWSFIIKMHALIESSLNRLIEAIFNDFSFDDYFLTLALSGGRHSKLKLLQKLDKIEPEECKFIEGLSSIRNRLVHNITHIKFNLQTYVTRLSATDKKKFATQTCNFFVDSNDILEKPKHYLWLCALHIIAMASLRTTPILYKVQIKKLKKEIYELEEQRAKELLRLFKEDLNSRLK